MRTLAKPFCGSQTGASYNEWSGAAITVIINLSLVPHVHVRTRLRLHGRDHYHSSLDECEAYVGADVDQPFSVILTADPGSYHTAHACMHVTCFAMHAFGAACICRPSLCSLEKQHIQLRPHAGDFSGTPEAHYIIANLVRRGHACLQRYKARPCTP